MMDSSHPETDDGDAGATFSNITVEKDVSVYRTESGVGDRKETIETRSSFDGQFMGMTQQVSSAAKALVGRSTTLTEALKAASMTVGHKPVEASDAAAIKEVEARATGTKLDARGGITAAAENAAARNAEMGVMDHENDQTTLSDVVADVDNKLKRDRPVMSEDADAVAAAELRHSPDGRTTPGGIAESVAAAYKLNRDASM